MSSNNTLSDNEIRGLLDKGQKGKVIHWVVKVVGDCNDADYSNEILEYESDESFIEEGLPLSLMLKRLEGDYKLERCEDWLYNVLGDFDCIPGDQYGLAHTLYSVEVKGPKGDLDLNVFNDEQAKELIRKFLTDEEIFGYIDYDVDEIMNTLFEEEKKR